MYFVSPPETQMKSDILAYLDEHDVQYVLETDLDRVVGEVDVVYQTRIHPERVCDRAALKRYAIDSSVLPPDEIGRDHPPPAAANGRAGQIGR